LRSVAFICFVDAVYLNYESERAVSNIYFAVTVRRS
jgi:hypothetical protein